MNVGRVAVLAVLVVVVAGSGSAFTVDTSTDWQDNGQFFNTTESGGALQLLKQKIVDSFEDDDMSEYSGDGVDAGNTGFTYTEDLKAVDGSLVAVHESDGKGIYEAYSTSGLSNYPQQGDMFNFTKIDMKDCGDCGYTFNVLFGVQDGSNWYEVEFRQKSSPDTLKIIENSGGSRSSFSSDSSSSDKGADVNITVQVDWQSDGTIEATAFDGDTQYITTSGSDSSHTDGGIGFGHDGNGVDSNMTIDFYNIGGFPPAGNWTGDRRVADSDTDQTIKDSSDSSFIEVDLSTDETNAETWLNYEAFDANNNSLGTTTFGPVTGTGPQNLTGTDDIPDHRNYRVWFNMTSGSTDDVDSFTVKTEDANAAPTVSFNPSSTSDGLVTQDTFAFVNVSASDDNGLSFVRETFDGTNSTFADAQDRGGNWWENHTGLSEGSHTFQGWANDTADQFTFTSERTVTVDLTPPSLNVSQPVGNTSKTFIPLNYTVSDPHLDFTTFSVDGGANTTLPSNGNTTFNVTDIGTHTVDVWTNDTAGNVQHNSTSFTADHVNEIRLDDADSGDSISDFTVIYSNGTDSFTRSTTDGAANFNTSRLPTGTDTLTLKAAGYDTRNGPNQTVDASYEINTSFDMNPAGITVSVQDEESHALPLIHL